jgi:MFS family permease
MSIPFAISAALTPFLGGLVDKFGQRVTLMYLSGFAVALVHGLFGFTSISTIPPLVIMGVAYSVYASAIWPSVPLVVKEHQLGTAYGVVTSIQNAGLAFVPMIVGAVVNASGTPDNCPDAPSDYKISHQSYHWVSVLFMSIGCLGVLFSIILNILDSSRGTGLNKPRTKFEPAKVDATLTSETYQPPSETANDSSHSTVTINNTE